MIEKSSAYPVVKLPQWLKTLVMSRFVFAICATVARVWPSTVSRILGKCIQASNVWTKQTKTGPIKSLSRSHSSPGARPITSQFINFSFTPSTFLLVSSHKIREPDFKDRFLRQKTPSDLLPIWHQQLNNDLAFKVRTSQLPCTSTTQRWPAAPLTTTWSIRFSDGAIHLMLFRFSSLKPLRQIWNPVNQEQESIPVAPSFDFCTCLHSMWACGSTSKYIMCITHLNIYLCIYTYYLLWPCL